MSLMVSFSVVGILVFHFRITKERDISKAAVLKFSSNRYVIATENKLSQV